MLTFSIFTGLVVSALARQADTFHKIDLPHRRSVTRSTGEVDGPALLKSLQHTLNKYWSRFPVPEASAHTLLQKRLVTENLLDQVEDGFDEQYYGPMEVGSRGNEQVFTVQFDTGSSDIFIPGPQCTTDQGCSSRRKYNERGIFQNRTSTVEYGSGSAEGDDFIDAINVAGLTATDQGFISLTQTTGFNTSQSDGLLGMGFSSIAASGFTTFFENLILQGKVASPEFSFHLGRFSSGTSHTGTLCLGCRDPTHYTPPFTTIPILQPPGYWQIPLSSVTVSSTPIPSTDSSSSSSAIIDTGTTLILAPVAAASAIFALIPGSFAIPFAGYSEQVFWAYPCGLAEGEVPVFRFGSGGRGFGIAVEDFNFGALTGEFLRLVGGNATRKQVARDAAEDDFCVAAIVGTDVSPEGNVYVIGDAFLKSWYATFSYGDPDPDPQGGEGPSVSFAEAV